jgi:hypothetical protein
MMETLIQLDVRSQYGKPTAYPNNFAGEQIAKIAGQTTLTISTLETAAALGFDFECLQVTGEYYPVAIDKIIAWLRGEQS